ncbi:MAG: hypothetical protein VYE30_12860, partial [Pseudomonadota bacterium]|nr:hypothetical protein [Pseudomonadota bacterium]
MGANYSGLIKAIFLCVFAAQPSSILLAQMIDREDRVLFQNARIVIGDGGIIENGSLFIENGAITGVSSQTFAAQAGTIVVDASGKTIIPALIDGHSHLGYQGRSSWGSQNYGRENLIDNLEQYAYYGFSAVFSAGSDAPSIVNEVEVSRMNGEFVGAQLLFA